MTKKNLRDKPLASARELHRLLRSLPEKTSLTPHQDEVLNRDIESLERFISILTGTSSKDDWRKAWRMISDMNKTFGGYVGDQLGQNLNQLFDALWKDVLESYSEVND